MVRTSKLFGGGVAIAAVASWFVVLHGQPQAEGVPRGMPPTLVDAKPGESGPQTALFAGGCFWGVQGVFEHIAGVTQVIAGYSGGHVADPSYEQVSSGRTGHAEAVQVTFDPARVSYGKLLQIFFSVALDPTEMNRQGPDSGTQYRSALFVNGPEQDRIARSYIGQLTAAHLFSRPIVTQVDPAGPFYPAEAYHQDYLVRHPDRSYIAAYDLPKVNALQALFPENWRAEPVTAESRLSSN